MANAKDAARIASNESEVIIVTPKELADIAYDHAINAEPLCVLGPPGCGKSEILVQVATKANLNVLPPYNLAICDGSEFKGVPSMGEDFLRWVKEKRWSLAASEPCFTFLDEFSQGSTAAMNSCAPLVLERRIDDLYLHNKSWVALAMNRQQDRAGTNRMPNQIPNRMTIVEITYDSDSHIEHEVARDDTDMLTVRYLRMKGNAAYEYDANKMVNPTMRQWSWVSRALFRNPDLHMATIAGRIGKGFATELLAFRDLAPMLPSREEVILNPKQAKVPEDPSAQFLITDMLADAAGVGNIDKLLDYCKRLPKEMQAKFCKAAAMRHSEILATAAFGKWAVEFQSVLR